jgi:hypothetical protein
MYAERYRPAAPDGGATGAPAAGVSLACVCSGGFGPVCPFPFPTFLPILAPMPSPKSNYEQRCNPHGGYSAEGYVARLKIGISNYGGMIGRIASRLQFNGGGGRRAEAGTRTVQNEDSRRHNPESRS